MVNYYLAIVIKLMKFQIQGYRTIKVLAFKWYDDMVYKTAEF